MSANRFIISVITIEAMLAPVAGMGETSIERVSFAGYVMGESYNALTNGGKVIYGDVVKHYMGTAPMAKPFHGLKTFNLELSPKSFRLMKMFASRTDFKDRTELMEEGSSMLNDLGMHFGKPLSNFKFSVPDSPYWPSRKMGIWSGSLPNLMDVDGSLWPTAKTIFAVSDTDIGTSSVQVKLSAVYFDEYTMSLVVTNGAAMASAEKEFQSVFRAKHDGMTFNEWSQNRIFKNSPAFKMNERRQEFTNELTIAGWTIDDVVDTNKCGGAFLRGFIYGSHAQNELSTPFLGIYPFFGVSLDESNRVSCVALRTEITNNPNKAVKWFQDTKEFLRENGMDDCFEESSCSADTIRSFINSQSHKVAGGSIMCKLHWVDKSRTLQFAVDMNIRNPKGVDLHFVVRRVKLGILDYTWRSCMNAAAKRLKEKLHSNDKARTDCKQINQ